MNKEEIDQLKEVDRQICNEELITKDKYQSILEENAKQQKEIEDIKEQLKAIKTIIEDILN